MTYEEKLLTIFSRFRGAGTDPDTLGKMEEACRAEVWAHLPVKIRHSWRLRLDFNRDNPSQIDLCPEQTGDASAKELEIALRSPFEMATEQAPSGGIMGFSMNFSHDPEGKDPHPAQVIDASTQAPRPNESVPPSIETKVPLQATDNVRKHRDVPLSAREIEAQAIALGITLPPNSSLLQPFLEALSAATEFKKRAELAEESLRKLGVL